METTLIILWTAICTISMATIVMIMAGWRSPWACLHWELLKNSVLAYLARSSTSNRRATAKGFVKSEDGNHLGAFGRARHAESGVP